MPFYLKSIFHFLLEIIEIHWRYRTEAKFDTFYHYFLDTIHWALLRWNFKQIDGKTFLIFTKNQMRNQTNKIQKRYVVFFQYFRKIKNKIGYDLLAFVLCCYYHSWYTIRETTKIYAQTLSFIEKLRLDILKRIEET